MFPRHQLEAVKFPTWRHPMVIDRLKTAAMMKQTNPLDVSGQKELSALPASMRWSAPEVLASPRASEDFPQPDSSSASFQTGVLGPPCDVYSFAMLLWELSTCSDPFEDIADERQASVVRAPVRMKKIVVQFFKNLFHVKSLRRLSTFVGKDVLLN
jgi:hypothetical protein